MYELGDGTTSVKIYEPSDSIENMSPAELQHLLERVTMRKGLRLDIEEIWTTGAPALRFTIEVENTYRPGEFSKLLMLKKIPAFVRTVEDFYDWCLAYNMWFERHECREWFKVDGKPWRDPHAHNGFNDHYHEDEMWVEVLRMRELGGFLERCRSCS